MLKSIFSLLTTFSFSFLFSQQIIEMKNLLPQRIEPLKITRNYIPVINLEPQKTILYLDDYFIGTTLKKLLQLNFKIIAPDGLNAEFIDNNQLLISGTPIDELSYLTLATDAEKITLVLQKSRKVTIEFSWKSNKDYTSVNLIGDMNGWNAKANQLQKKGDTWHCFLELNEGFYGYQIEADGKRLLDENNPIKVSNGMGGFNSQLKVGEPIKKRPFLFSNVASENKIELGFADKPDKIIALWENKICEASLENDKIIVHIPIEASYFKRSHIRVWTLSNNLASNEVLIPLSGNQAITNSNQLNRADKHAYIMYFLMVDRFKNGNQKNDKKINSPEVNAKVDYFGGDMEGISQKINDGYFSKLGINTLWLSPIIQNPDKPYGQWQNPKTKFSGYHGYWPISSTKIDYRFGNDEVFSQMINFSHNKNMNVLIDYVANHVHEEHPLYKNNTDWATPLYLPDGTKNTEKWDEHRLTTWFDDFMPSLDFSRPEIVDAMTDSAVYWFKKFKIDGFRHDATKHIQTEFWRTLTYKLNTQVIDLEKDRKLYQIGETYGNPELIGSYIGPGLLDAQFDFNLYDAAVACFANENPDVKNLKRVLDESLDYYGQHNLMGNITGNQDRTRFISYADGSVKFNENPKQAGWDRKIENANKTGFKRLSNLMAFLMTIPGIPVIYYGDEIGLPGANDPDNRRMMLFENLNKNQLEMLDLTQKLVNLRKANLNLNYGEFNWIKAENGTLVFYRNYLGKVSISVFNLNNSAKTIEFELPKEITLKQHKANFGNVYQVIGNKIKINLAPETFEIINN